MLKHKGFLTIALITILSLSFTINCFADSPPKTTAKSAIIINQDRNKILYEINAGEKMYPASMTKILTSLVAVDYIKSNETVFAGNEIYDIPLDSSKAGHILGEAISGENLIRLLIIPSGNETASIIAQNVAEKVSGNKDLSYIEAEKIFSNLMNEKAKSLGANSSNFITPHGYHDPNHYTTAKDMALISQAAMKNKLIRKIVSEKEFNGNGIVGKADPLWITKNYKWKTHNNLIIQGVEGYFPYATGIKTGFTDEAGDCVSASASKDGENLIAIVFNSPDPERWNDSIKLFNYGFDNFKVREVQKAGQLVETVGISNSKLGESKILELKTKSDFTEYLSEEQQKKIQKKIFIAEEVKAMSPKDAPLGEQKQYLKAPITDKQVIGKITYMLEGKEIFNDHILATRYVDERTFTSDVKYYLDKTIKFMFSLKAIPFWILTIAIIALIVFIIKKIKRKKNRNFYRLKNRY